jgi:hypothetical protein
MKFKSLDDLSADPDEEPEDQRSSGLSLWGYFRQKGALLRSNSLTDLFATAMGYVMERLASIATWSWRERAFGVSGRQCRAPRNA